MEENNGVISPRFTRSAKKEGRSSYIPRYKDSSPLLNSNARNINLRNSSNSGIFQMTFSPPNEMEIRNRERKLAKERKAELDGRKRQEGCVMFLSPGVKRNKCKQAHKDERDDSRGEDPPNDGSIQNDEKNCFEVHSKESNNHNAEGDISLLSKGSVDESGIQARVHELEKVEATLEAENKCLRSQLHEEHEKVEKLENENKHLTIQVAKSMNNLEMKDIIQSSVEEIRRTASTEEKSVKDVETDYKSRLAIAEREKMELYDALENEKQKANQKNADILAKTKQKYCNELDVVKEKLHTITKKNEIQIRSALEEKKNYEMRTCKTLFTKEEEYTKKTKLLNEKMMRSEEGRRKVLADMDQVKRENLEMRETLEKLTNDKKYLCVELEQLQDVLNGKANAYKDIELSMKEKESEHRTILQKEMKKTIEYENCVLLLQNKLTNKEKEQQNSDEALKKSFNEKKMLMLEEMSRMKLEHEKVVNNEDQLKNQVRYV